MPAKLFKNKRRWRSSVYRMTKVNFGFFDAEVGHPV